MRVLLDECIPRRFKDALAGHDCVTASEAGFAGEKNGKLLSLAERQGFQVFVTLDKGVQYQQNLANLSIAILIIRAKSSRLADLLPHAGECLKKIPSIRASQIIVIGSA